jgi:hypothetical protein
VLNEYPQKLPFDLHSTHYKGQFFFSILAAAAVILATANEHAATDQGGYVLQLDYVNKTTGMMEFRALRCSNVYIMFIHVINTIQKSELLYSKSIKNHIFFLKLLLTMKRRRS